MLKVARNHRTGRPDVHSTADLVAREASALRGSGFAGRVTLETGGVRTLAIGNREI